MEKCNNTGLYPTSCHRKNGTRKKIPIIYYSDPRNTHCFCEDCLEELENIYFKQSGSKIAFAQKNRTPSSRWKKSLIDKYNIHVIKKEGQCWGWNGTIGSGGYGKLSFQGKNIGAHRVSWILSNGEIPNKLFVLHKCDNPPCTNPDHLFVGTHKDNIEDMIKKKRAAWQKNKNWRHTKTKNKIHLDEQCPKHLNVPLYEKSDSISDSNTQSYDNNNRIPFVVSHSNHSDTTNSTG